VSANPNWIGTYIAGSTSWDTVAMQEAIYAALAHGSTHGSVVWNSIGGSTSLNKAIFIPPGQGYINQQLLAVGQFFSVFGVGKNLSVLNYYGPNTGDLWLFDSAAYATFSKFGMQAQVTTSGALLDLDHDGTYGGLATQQDTLSDLFISGNGLGAVGLRISKSGGAAQGDTINLDNDYFGETTFACVSIGAPGESPAFNALAISFHGGDAQSCLPYGIYNNGGQIYVDGMNFEDQAGATITNNQIVDHGYDIYTTTFAGNSGISTIKNVRSESDAFFCCVPADLENVSVNGELGQAQWSASTVVGQGQIAYGTPGVGEPGQNGYTMMAIQGGTTGTTEPTWATSLGQGVNAAGGAMTSGSNQLTGASLTNEIGQNAAVGWGVMVQGAGQSGGPLFTTITAVVGTTYTLAANASTTVSASEVYAGPLLTDGTVQWMDVNWFTVVSPRSIRESTFGAGRVMIVSPEIDVDNVRFGRPDFLPASAYGGPGVGENAFPGYWRNVQVLAGGQDLPGVIFNPMTDRTFQSIGQSGLPAVRQWNNNLGQCQFSDPGFNNQPPVSSVGWCRGYTGYSAYANPFAIYGFVSRAPQTLVNTQGTDLDLGGGLGTGTGANGGVYLDGGAGASSGSGINDATMGHLFGCPAGGANCMAYVPLKPPSYAVAGLPACSAAMKGAEAEVTDASSPVYLAALTGGGSTLTPVVCNGSVWLSY
ncbi:MAG: hypothetical protein ACREEQ_12515, partial [Caulobacteraceae bacterium]